MPENINKLSSDSQYMSTLQNLACVASASVQFRSKGLQGDKWSAPFSTQAKYQKIPLLGLSLLPKPMETLATQASQNQSVK